MWDVGSEFVEPFSPIATGERSKLFQAAHKLLMFVLHEASAQTLNEEERALREALRPLVENEDGHFIAAVTALVQSLLEGKTDHQWCIWSRQNAISCCHDCWAVSDGPHTPNHDCHDCHQGECGGICLCQAFSAARIT